VGNNCGENTKEIVRCEFQGKKSGVRSQNEEKKKEKERGS